MLGKAPQGAAKRFSLGVLLMRFDSKLLAGAVLVLLCVGIAWLITLESDSDPGPTQVEHVLYVGGSSNLEDDLACTLVPGGGAKRFEGKCIKVVPPGTNAFRTVSFEYMGTKLQLNVTGLGDIGEVTEASKHPDLKALDVLTKVRLRNENAPSQPTSE